MTLTVATCPAAAQNATWLANPGSSDFDTAANWNPAIVPTGTAFFGTSSTTGVTFSAANNNIGGWTFNAGASNYTFTSTGNIFFNSAGIIVNGGSATITLGFLNDLAFYNTSTAGRAKITSNEGLTDFYGSSNAGSATINGGAIRFWGSSNAGSAIIDGSGVGFHDTSTAGTATISSDNGSIQFTNNSTAGTATISSYGTITQFMNNSTAGSAMITVNGGATTQFTNNSTGGQAQFITNAGSETDFTGTTGPNGDGKITAGSIAGAGRYFLGSNELTVGGNDLNTTVSGVVSDCGGNCLNPGATGGSLVKVGTGTLTLTGANIYTGGTTISGGTLVLTNNSGAGIAGIAMRAGTTLGLDNAAIANTVSGGGDPNIAVIGASSMPTYTGNTSTTFNILGTDNNAKTDVLTLTTANATFSGSTLVGGSAAGSSVTLKGGATNAFGSASEVAVFASSVLDLGGFNQTIGSLAGSITGSASGGTVTNSGASGTNTLTIGGAADTSISSFAGTIQDGTNAKTALTVSGTSTIVELLGANTYTGGTTIGAGVLELGNAAGLQGSIVGNVTNNGVLIFNRFGTFTTNGVISGTGSVTQMGDNTEIFTANNTYTGGTTIQPGSTLQLGNGGTSGSIVGFVSNLGTLAFDRSDAVTFAGVIANITGTVEQIGSGSLTLSGMNIYFGPTNVSAGTLNVIGSIAGSSLTTVASGATLTGNGTVGNVQVNAGATFAPGTAGVPGTAMTIVASGLRGAVATNLAFQAGALYVVYLNPTTSTFANVSGTASLAGTVNANFAIGAYISKQYAILTAGSVSGSFANLATSNLPANFTASLAYDSAHAYLDLTLNFTPPVAPVFTPLNGNQANVANTLVTYFNTTGSIPTKFGTLSSSDLTAVDGEDATGAEHSAFELTNEFLSLMLDPFVYGRGGAASGGGALGFARDQEASFPSEVALAYTGILKAPPNPAAPLDQRWTVWGSSFGGSGTANGDPTIGSNNVTTSTFGFAAGADYHVSPDTVLGFALAGSGTNWNFAQALGTGRSDAFQAGVYGTKYFGPAYIGTSLAFTNNWFTTHRTALGDQLTASFQGQSLGARVEGGYRYAVAPAAGVTPYAAIQAQSFYTPSYSETDLTGGVFGLSYNAMKATDTRSELGARLDALTAWGATPVQLRARLAWAHDWVSNPALDASFQALAGTSFVVEGAPVPHDSALTSVGVELHLTQRWTLLGKFDGEFASSSQIYAGSGTLRYVW